jgi:hypothetical protein
LTGAKIADGGRRGGTGRNRRLSHADPRDFSPTETLQLSTEPAGVIEYIMLIFIHFFRREILHVMNPSSLRESRGICKLNWVKVCPVPCQ